MRQGQRERWKRGYGLWRPSEAMLKLRYPSSLLLSPFPPGGGDKHETPRNRGYRSKQTGHVLAPTKNGPKLSRNKARMERSDHLQAMDRQSACQRGRWRAECPSPTASAIGRCAEGSPEGTERLASMWRARRPGRDARNCIQDRRHNQVLSMTGASRSYSD